MFLDCINRNLTRDGAARVTVVKYSFRLVIFADFKRSAEDAAAGMALLFGLWLIVRKVEASCRMRGGNQLGPLLRRLCLNGSSSSLAAVSSSSLSESYTKTIFHTSPTINLVFSRHLVDSTSPCPGFVQSFSTLAEASPTSPPDFQGIQPSVLYLLIDHFVSRHCICWNVSQEREVDMVCSWSSGSGTTEDSVQTKRGPTFHSISNKFCNRLHREALSILSNEWRSGGASGATIRGASTAE